MWIIYLIIASIISVSMNMKWSSIREFNGEVIFLLCFSIPLSILYWLSFSKSPSFIICFVLSIAIPSIIAFTVDFIYFKSIQYNVYNITGILLLLFGCILLKMKYT